MATTDWQGVVEALKDYVDEKHERGENSFGHRELTDVLARLEREHRLPESLVAKALRHYGQEIVERLSTAPDASDAESVNGNGAKQAAS